MSTEAVTPEVAQAVPEAIREKGPISGIHALQALTGFGLRDAKDWVDNCGEYYRKPTGVCSYCGLDTRSPEAKQCRHCFRDWHDESRIRLLGTDEPWKHERE